jgi:protocatechuate 3,4-dioxygenase beta subunit
LTLPACIVRPQQTEGPYFVDEDLNRSDIRIDPSTGKLSSGTPLVLRFEVSRASGKSACVPLPGARVDIWHCNAQGVYSDVVDPSFNTKGQKFLRGYQRTNSSGVATFTTIYPGWYQGRAVHIHFKVISGDREFTSQLYFPDTLTDRVQSAGYYAKPGSRTRNEEDGIFSNGGKALTLDPQRSGKGYAAIFSIGLA